jgi:general secretion pathway protein E
MRRRDTLPRVGEPLFDAVAAVDALLTRAVDVGASDIHLTPGTQNLTIQLRVDGLLRNEPALDAAPGRSVVHRLMVLARLLTYRLDVPQEGRAAVELPARLAIEVRVAVMPTTHGLRCVVRLPVDRDLDRTRSLETLGLPESTLLALRRALNADDGLVLVVGPAGSGKTTTLHACLSHLSTTRPELSLLSIEDPVERNLPGVAQIEVTPFGELTYARALRSALRQDPQVIMVGEVRDAETAGTVVQASLTGHRLLCTMHAGSPGGAVARLIEMGIEPYRITSSLRLIVNQRLLRTLAGPASYKGRTLVAEHATTGSHLRRAILDRADTAALQDAITRDRVRAPSSIDDHARTLVARGITDDAEVQRVLGEGAG